MEETASEGCCVCWLPFSNDTIPVVLLPCCHSTCEGCFPALRRCPICRAKLTRGRAAARNWALISAIERINSQVDLQTAPIQRPETKDVQMQTENDVFVRPRRVRPSEITTEPVVTAGQPSSRRKHQDLRIRLSRDQSGTITSFELRFK